MTTDALRAILSDKRTLRRASEEARAVVAQAYAEHSAEQLRRDRARIDKQVEQDLRDLNTGRPGAWDAMREHAQRMKTRLLAALSA